MPTKKKILLLEKHHKKLSLVRQCRLLGMARSTAYYLPRYNARDELIMREIDTIFTRRPFYGSRRICFELKAQGYVIGRKHTATLMEDMGIEAVYPKKKTSISNKSHKVYPYLLRNVKVCRPNQV